MIAELLAVLLVAALVGAFLLVRSLDLDSYRDRIAEQIHEATGREVRIRGRLRVELSLTPTISFGGLWVGGGVEKSEPALLDAKRLELRLRLVPLFSRRLEVERVVLSGAEISLETDRQGRGNWQFDGSQQTTPRALVEVRIEDSNLRYFDQGSGWRSEVGLARFSAWREKVSPDRFRFQGRLRSGTSDLEGSGVLDLGAAPQRIEARLEADHFDLADVTSSRGGGVKSFANRQIPFNALRSLDGELRFDARTFVLGVITLEELATDLRLRRGVLTLDSLRAKLAGGELSGRATVDSNVPTAAVAAKFDAQRVDLSRLWEDFKIRGVIDGRAILDADVRGAGDTFRAILASLDGETTLAMGEGRLLSSVIDRIAPDLLPSIAPWASEQKNTRVNCAVGRFEIHAGRSKSKLLLLDTERMTLVGNGEIDLASQSIDLSVDPSPKDLTVTRLAVPFRIHGPLAAPDAFAESGDIFKGIGDTVFRSILLPPALIGRLLDLGMGANNPCVQARADADSGTRSMLEERKASSGGFESFVGEIGDGVKGVGRRVKKLFNPWR